MKKPFMITKQQLRQLLGFGDMEMSASSWRRFWRRYKLPEALGISEEEFSRRRVFYLSEYEKLKAVIGFDDTDVNEQ